MKQFFLSMNLCMLSFVGVYAMQPEQEDCCMGSPEQLQEEIRRSWEEFNEQKTPEQQEKFLEKNAQRLSAKLSRRADHKQLVDTKKGSKK